MELVLNTFGTSLNRDNEGFVVRCNGRVQRIPLQGITAILVGKGVQLTSDAVMLAIENEIDVLFVGGGVQACLSDACGVRATVPSAPYARDS